jgi:hypothetical protein
MHTDDMLEQTKVALTSSSPRLKADWDGRNSATSRFLVTDTTFAQAVIVPMARNTQKTVIDERHRMALRYALLAF